MANGDNAAFPTEAAIEKIVSLGKKASDATIVSIDTTNLGAGLPTVVPVLWDRNNQTAHSLRKLVEEWRNKPERVIGSANAQTLKSFIDLINRHKNENSAVFGDLNWREPKFTAVIDYIGHGADPAFGVHRILYAFPLSESFKAWSSANGKKMNQADFAAFVEDHIADIAAPTDEERAAFESLVQTKFATPAELMQLSRGLQVNVNTVVKNAKTLQSGEGEVLFSEEHTDVAGARLTVPGLFLISIPIYLFGDPVRLPVRLRYRVESGKLAWFYQLWNIEEFVTKRIADDLTQVEAETLLPAFDGSPEPSQMRTAS